MVMCVGNVWSYVPGRAITTRARGIAIAATGLRVGVWSPVSHTARARRSAVMGHFFARTCPRFIPAIGAGSAARRVLIVASTAVWIFMLFGESRVLRNLWRCLASLPRSSRRCLAPAARGGLAVAARGHGPTLRSAPRSQQTTVGFGEQSLPVTKHRRHARAGAGLAWICAAPRPHAPKWPGPSQRDAGAAEIQNWSELLARRPRRSPFG
ncbi:hypothetical protein ACRAWD_07190 [Caulobacter segnis]